MTTMIKLCIGRRGSLHSRFMAFLEAHHLACYKAASPQTRGPARGLVALAHVGRRNAAARSSRLCVRCNRRCRRLLAIPASRT
ncbi:hypothetical protein GUJ93_ZPchr0006g41525 [Zizania palustris]|uniref:Uncharacterized protein n=1 Tax=Zizania palustris TaxID=103762 RepID=A0A8J5SYF6_ZIZPA|nr:hypothetical protein GUJ93_ZPchr0006g41525 [Zizania palustris]